MEEAKYIVDIFAQHGLLAGSAILALTLIIVLLKSSWVREQLAKFGVWIAENVLKMAVKDPRKNSRKLDDSDITNHEVFNYIKIWKYARIPTISFSTEYRTAVFRKYLFVYLDCYKDNLRKFVESEYEEMTPAEIKGAFLDMINITMFDYERKMAEQGIPKAIIDKMRIKNANTMTLTIDLIEGICSSDFYESENNYLKTYSIFNIIMSILDNTLANAGKVCDSINGELAGLSFNDGGRIVTEPTKKN